MIAKGRALRTTREPGEVSVVASKVVYAAASGADPSGRRSKAEQRALAANADARLAPYCPAIRSRTHSRGVAVAAVATGEVERLGVDTEYADPGRPWFEIAKHYLGEA